MSSYGESMELPFCYGSVCHSMFTSDEEEDEIKLVIKENKKEVIDLYITIDEFIKIKNLTTTNTIYCVSDDDVDDKNKLFVKVTNKELELIWLDAKNLSKDLYRWDFCKSKNKTPTPWFSIKVCKKEFNEFVDALFSQMHK
jgi:hypothetical protein